MESCYAVISADDVSSLDLSEFRGLSDDTVVYFNNNTEAYCMWIGEVGVIPTSLASLNFKQFTWNDLQSYIGE